MPGGYHPHHPLVVRVSGRTGIDDVPHRAREASPAVAQEFAAWLEGVAVVAVVGVVRPPGRAGRAHGLDGVAVAVAESIAVRVRIAGDEARVTIVAVCVECVGVGRRVGGSTSKDRKQQQQRGLLAHL